MAVDLLSSATAMLAQLRVGSVTSAGLVEAMLERIEQRDAELRAFVTVDHDRARRDAARADEQRAAGGPCGPLHGLPISLKDCLATAGLRTTSGKQDMVDHVPEHDAVAVARLRAAGAIVLGKTNLPAGVSGQETANAAFGRTVNPWDR